MRPFGAICLDVVSLEQALQDAIREARIAQVLHSWKLIVDMRIPLLRVVLRGLLGHQLDGMLQALLIQLSQQVAVHHILATEWLAGGWLLLDQLAKRFTLDAHTLLLLKPDYLVLDWE